MKIPREIIDNSENNTLVDFLNATLEDIPTTNLDIATAFFNLRAYELVRENLESVTRFRLLLGTLPEFSNDDTLGDVLLREIRREIEELPLSREANETIIQCIAFLQRTVWKYGCQIHFSMEKHIFSMIGLSSDLRILPVQD